MTQSTIKIVEIQVEKEFTEPKGWILKDVYNSDATNKFYVVLVKAQQPKLPEQPTKL